MPFPRPVPSQTVVGTVTSAAAKQTGLREGTPVVAGLTDVQASMIGAGAIRVESACSIVGTSSLNNVVLDRPSFEPAGIGFLVAAKSILRFEEAKDQKLAEYVLIGSLLSFSIAIALSAVTKWAMQF